jgi:small subunit ribosomal protein S21
MTMIARMAGSNGRRRSPSGNWAARVSVAGLDLKTSGVIVVKLTLRDRESAQEAVRRFRKLVERSGIKKEMRVREFYEKPSETKRRARLRAQRRARRERFFATH